MSSNEIVPATTSNDPTKSSNNASSQLPHKNSTLCRFWLKGYCKKGDQCTFSHDIKYFGKNKKKPKTTGPSGSRNRTRRSKAGSRKTTADEEQVQKERERARLLDMILAKGADGSTLFVNLICPFLTVRDMLVCAQTGKTMHRLCRTWTVPEVLETKTRELSKQHRIRLGTYVYDKVVAYRERKGLVYRQRPTRITILGESECFRARLYHPEELPEIHRIIDPFLEKYGTAKLTEDSTSSASTSLGDTPILLKATFGPSITSQRVHGRTIDVTKQVRAVIAAKGDGKRLILKSPPVVRNGMGKAVREPITFRWWYTRLFGDPCPHTTKSLILRIRNRRTKQVYKVVLEENTHVDMALANK